MNLLTRDVDPVAIKKIDELAKERGMSRNEFVKMLLEKTAVMPELESGYDRFELALSKVSDLLKLHIERMDSLEKGYEKLFVLITLATGIPLSDVDNFLKNKTIKENSIEGYDVM